MSLRNQTTKHERIQIMSTDTQTSSSQTEKKYIYIYIGTSLLFSARHQVG